MSPGQRVVDPDYIKQRTMKYCNIFLAFLLTCSLDSKTTLAEEKKDLGAQFAENPPMHVISRTPPAPITDTFEIRKGYTLIKTLDEFRVAICGDRCTFIFHDGTIRPLPKEVNRLNCGGRKGLRNSAVTNYTRAELILNERVQNCVIKSVGPVEDHGRQNTIIKIEPETTADQKRGDWD